MVIIRAGDVVKALGMITEEDEEYTYSIAEAGHIGHVIGLTDSPEWIDVYFSEWGTVTTVHVDQVECVLELLPAKSLAA